MVSLSLRFPRTRIQEWADRYSFPGEDELIEMVASPARDRGCLRRDEFMKLCAWKTPRSKPRCAANTDDSLRKVTRIALDPGSPERVKIEILTQLSGVGWPTASVILHLCDKNLYPILDYRALWSVGVKAPSQYGFELWQAYTQFTRELSREAGCSMRTLDRALWQYSKEHQPGSR